MDDGVSDPKVCGQLLNRLSSWIEEKSPSSSQTLVIELQEEWQRAEEEARSFFQSSESLQTAFSQIIGKYHDGRRT